MFTGMKFFEFSMGTVFSKKFYLVELLLMIWQSKEDIRKQYFLDDKRRKKEKKKESLSPSSVFVLLPTAL